MAKRYSTRGLAKDRVYTVKTASRILHITEGTFRKFFDRGLRAATTSRPILIRGADLIKFLENLAKANKQPCRPEQFYCMRCKGPQDALGQIADYRPNNAKTGRLEALCEGCGGSLSKFSSPRRVEDLAPLLDIQISAHA